MWKNIVETGRPQMTYGASALHATNTLSEYKIFIAFPVERWLRENASMLRYTYSASLFIFVERYL
jgi:hypothetical protein